MATSAPAWHELLRALWPVFVLIFSLALGGVVLALKAIFVTRDAHKDHDERIDLVETFVIEQKTALGILPTRQDLGRELKQQGERISETRAELSEQISELGERMAGVEAGLSGIGKQNETTNTYLNILIERGMRQ